MATISNYYQTILWLLSEYVHNIGDESTGSWYSRNILIIFLWYVSEYMFDILHDTHCTFCEYETKTPTYILSKGMFIICSEFPQIVIRAFSTYYPNMFQNLGRLFPIVLSEQSENMRRASPIHMLSWHSQNILITFWEQSHNINWICSEYGVANIHNSLWTLWKVGRESHHAYFSEHSHNNIRIAS